MTEESKLISHVSSDYMLEDSPTDEGDSALLIQFMQHLHSAGLLIKEPKSVEIKTIDMYDKSLGQKRIVTMTF